MAFHTLRYHTLLSLLISVVLAIPVPDPVPEAEEEPALVDTDLDVDPDPAFTAVADSWITVFSTTSLPFIPPNMAPAMSRAMKMPSKSVHYSVYQHFNH